MRTPTPKQTLLRVRRASSSILGTRSVKPICTKSSSTATTAATKTTTALASKESSIVPESAVVSATKEANCSEIWLPDVQRKYIPVPLAADKLNVSRQNILYEKASSRRKRHREILRDFALQDEKFANSSNDDNRQTNTTESRTNKNAISTGSCNLVPLKRHHYTTSIALGSSNLKNSPDKVINTDLILDNNDPSRKRNHSTDPEEVFVHQMKSNCVQRKMNDWRRSYFSHFRQECTPNGDMLFKEKLGATTRQTTKTSNARSKRNSTSAKAVSGKKSSIKTKLLHPKRAAKKPSL